MPYGMYLSAAGAHVQAQRLQVLSNNMANVSTPGFKREFAVFQARNAEAIEQGISNAGSRQPDDLGGGVSFNETVTDFSPGPLQHTGNASDMAVEGKGFFLVERDGQQFLTRAGNFHFDSTGRLMTEQGCSVLASDRQPIVINPNQPWTVLNQGWVSQGTARTPIALVEPESLGSLTKVGESMFSPPAELRDVAAGERGIASGYLEQSAVEQVTEMVELIETSRAYEANVRMIQNQDQLLSSLVNRVLRV